MFHENSSRSATSAHRAQCTHFGALRSARRSTITAATAHSAVKLRFTSVTRTRSNVTAIAHSPS